LRGNDVNATVAPNFTSSNKRLRDRVSLAGGSVGLSLRIDTDPTNAFSSAHEARGMWARPVINTISRTPGCLSNQQAVSIAFSIVVLASGARMI
jgi:hypothetical protein